MQKITPTKYNDAVCCDTDSDEEHYPTVYLSGMPKKLISGQEAGDEVCVVLYGKLKEVATRDRDGDDDNSCSLDLEIHKADIVDPDEKSEWAELVEVEN